MKRNISGTLLVFVLSVYAGLASARYVQPDPIGLAGGLNPYGYVEGNPLQWTDPFGLNPKWTNPAANMPLGPGPGGAIPLPRWNPKPGEHKPSYASNPAHDPKSPLYNPKKTPEPKDCPDVYKRSVPDDPVDPRHWWGKADNGQYYRFHNSNDGTAHFSGSFSSGDTLIPRYVRERLGGQ